MKKILAVAVTVPALILTTFAGAGIAAETPSAPHNLVVKNVSPGTFETTWQTATKASEYQVFVNGVLKATSKDNIERITDLDPCAKLYFQTRVKVNDVWSPLATGSGSKTITAPNVCIPLLPAPITITKPAPSPAPTPPVVTTPAPTASAPAPAPTASPSPTAAPAPTKAPAPAPTASPATTTAPVADPGASTAAAKFGWGTPIAAGSDEFNYTGAPDSTKWNNYDTAGHHGNGRRMKAQSTVANGMLTQIGLSNGDTGYISSKYRPGSMYGKWETRMKTNAWDGEYHPVLLLWPDQGGNSTTESEVDYAEGGNDTSKMKFFLHYGAGGTTTQTSAEKVIDTTQWHNYAVEWSPEGVKGYIDGELWFTDTSKAHNPGQSMHQGIQLDWFPDGTALKQSEMQVDWTRTYK